MKDLTRSKKVHFSQLLTSAVCCLACWPHLVTLAPDWAHSSGGRSQFNTSGAGVSGERTAAAGPGWAEQGQAHSATSHHFTLRKLHTGPFSLCVWPLASLTLLPLLDVMMSLHLLYWVVGVSSGAVL